MCQPSASKGSAADCSDTVWEEALARGASTAGWKAAIEDGAGWVWEMASCLFPSGAQILDWYHLSQHLWEAAEERLRGLAAAANSSGN